MTLKRVLLLATLAGGAYAAARLASSYAPEGIRRAASDFATTVRRVSAEREAELRAALGLAVETDAMTPEEAAALLDDPAGRAL